MSTAVHDEEVSNASGTPASASVPPRRGTRMKKPPVHMQPEAAQTAGTCMPGDQVQTTSGGGGGGDGEVYCLCRSGDDGKPMVSCAQCEEWFHFRCVGLTKKVADCLATYVCSACQERTGKTSTTLDIPASSDAVLDTLKASSSHAGVEPAKFYNEVPGTPAVSHVASAKYGAKRKASCDAAQGPVDPPASTSTEPAPKKSRTVSITTGASSPPKLNSPVASRRVHNSGSPTQAAVGSGTSGSTTRPNAPALPKNNRKVSGSSVPRKASVVAAEAQGAAVRAHATQQFTSTLSSIFASATITVPGSDADVASASSDDVAVAAAAESPAERASTYARQLESRFFELYGEPAPAGAQASTLAGKAYKDKLRTLLFNLKDKNNTSLHARIASGSVAAHDLAGFSSEELANEERRLALEQAKKENLEQSVLKGQESGPRRKMTHKGEVDIEYEAGTLESAEAEAEDRRLRKEREKKRAEEAQAAAAAESTSRDSETPSGLLPDGGLEKRPSFGGTNNAFSPLPAQQSPLGTQTHQFDFAGLWTGGGSHSPEAGDDDDEDAGAKPDDDTAQPSTDEPMAESGDGITAATDDFIDSMLGLPSSPRVTSASPPKESPVAWKGAMSMPDIGAFLGSVRQVAGRDLRQNERAWALLFPSAHSAIEGRLPTKVAEDYLVQSHHAPRTELVACLVEPCFEAATVPSVSAQIPDVPTSAEANTAAFAKLAAYFYARGRYGVLAPEPSARGRIVKDFYVTSLPKDAALPEWLTLLDDAQQLNAMNQRTQDILLCVAVLFRGSLGDSQTAPTHGVSMDEPYRPQLGAGTPLGAAGAAGPSRFEGSASPGKPVAPPVDVSKLLAGGSNVLQDLLRAVGGGATADPGIASTGAVVAAHSGATSAAALDHVPAPAPGGENYMAAPTAAALSQLDTSNLEAVLAANPSLVDQLLSTLNGGATAAASSPPQMPGMPPARPHGIFPGQPQPQQHAYPGAPQMHQQQQQWGGPAVSYAPPTQPWQQQQQHHTPQYDYEGVPQGPRGAFGGAPYGPVPPFAPPGSSSPYGAAGVRPSFPPGQGYPAGAPGARPGGPPAGGWGRPAPPGRGW